MLHFRLAAAVDIPATVALINSAYRGDSSRAGWTTEADILGGQRTDLHTLGEILQRPGESLLIAVDAAGTVVGCAHLVQEPDQTLYFGMLTVSPDAQDQGIGRQLLAQIEVIARSTGQRRIRMTVIHLRHELMAWYERRGFARTGREIAFPMDDPRYGIPKVPLIVLWEFARVLDGPRVPEAAPDYRVKRSA